MSDIGKLRQKIVNACMQDIDLFIDNFGHIEDKHNTTDIVQPFNRWKEQREATTSIMSHRWNILLKARQLGFSWLMCHIAAWYLLRPGQTIIGLSKTEEEAKELVRRLTFILTYAPELFADKNLLRQTGKALYLRRQRLQLFVIILMVLTASLWLWQVRLVLVVLLQQT